MPEKVSLPSERIFCFLCNGIISIKEKSRVFDHFRIEHRSDYNLDFLLNVSMLGEKDKIAINKIIEEKNLPTKSVDSSRTAGNTKLQRIMMKESDKGSDENAKPVDDDTITVDGSVEVEPYTTGIVEDEELLMSSSVHEHSVPIGGISLDEYADEYASNLVEVDVSFEAENNHCPVCDATFASKNNVRRHLKNVHKILKNTGDEKVKVDNETRISDRISEPERKKKMTDERTEPVAKKLCKANILKKEFSDEDLSNSKTATKNVEMLDDGLSRNGTTDEKLAKNEEPRIECNLCNVNLSSSYLRRHMRRVHKTTLEEMTHETAVKTTLSTVEAEFRETGLTGSRSPTTTEESSGSGASDNHDTSRFVEQIKNKLSEDVEKDSSSKVKDVTEDRRMSLATVIERLKKTDNSTESQLINSAKKVKKHLKI